AGKSTFDVKAGDVYGYHMVGSHNTGSPSMSGSITILEVDDSAPSVTPVVTGTKAGGDFYSGTVHVKWTVKDDDSRLLSTTGCADATVTEDTAGKTITCAATSRGGTTTKSVTIKRDTAAPALTTPAAVVKQADGADGATVNFDATATDAIDPSPAVACAPASGTRFAVGTTTVTCTATDAAGNSATKSFDAIIFAVAAPTLVNPTAAPTTPSPKTIDASLAFRFTLVKQVTRLTALTVKKLPPGATLIVTCKGASCPKKLKGKGQTLVSKGASVSLSSLVKGDLKSGTTISVSISAAGAKPTTKTLKVRKGKAPVVGG
ncbi:MAG TPA: HYR domain-containing protein, partial [Solirubrobacter sp.]